MIDNARFPWLDECLLVLFWLQTADLREDLALATGRANELEGLWERGRADLERLEEGHQRAQSALDAKNQEVISRP